MSPGSRTPDIAMLANNKPTIKAEETPSSTEKNKVEEEKQKPTASKKEENNTD